jgi:hypothetical protein
MCNFDFRRMGGFGALDLNRRARQDDESPQTPDASRGTRLEWGDHV